MKILKFFMRIFENLENHRNPCDNQENRENATKSMRES